jgi:hypothetical protein
MGTPRRAAWRVDGLPIDTRAGILRVPSEQDLGSQEDFFEIGGTKRRAAGSRSSGALGHERDVATRGVKRAVQGECERDLALRHVAVVLRTFAEPLPTRFVRASSAS